VYSVVAPALWTPQETLRPKRVSSSDAMVIRSARDSSRNSDGWTPAGRAPTINISSSSASTSGGPVNQPLGKRRLNIVVNSSEVMITSLHTYDGTGARPGPAQSESAAVGDGPVRAMPMELPAASGTNSGPSDALGCWHCLVTKTLVIMPPSALSVDS
jgi:hypothetical protein